MRDLVQLARREDNQLYVVANDEDVMPMENFAPCIVIIDGSADVGKRRGAIRINVQKGNAYEIGEQHTIMREPCVVRAYAVTPYLISESFYLEAIETPDRHKKELTPKFF